MFSVITVDVGWHTWLCRQVSAPGDPQEPPGGGAEPPAGAGLHHPVPGDCPDLHTDLHRHWPGPPALQVLHQVSQGQLYSLKLMS